MIRLPSPLRPAIAGLALLAPALLGGCSTVVLSPAGDVAQQQGDLVVIATLLMLIIIVPVMALIAFFAWRYRQANTDAPYSPEWHHSTALETVTPPNITFRSGTPRRLVAAFLQKPRAKRTLAAKL